MADLTAGRLSIGGTTRDGLRRTYEFVYGQLVSGRWEYNLNAVNDIEMHSCSYTFGGDEQCLRRHIRRTVARWRSLEGVWYMDRPLSVRRGDGPVFRFTYRKEQRGEWLYTIAAVGKRSLSPFDVDSYTFKGSERALRNELRNTVNGWRYSHDAAKWLLDGLAIRRNDGRLFEFDYFRVVRGGWKFGIANVDSGTVNTSYHQFWGRVQSLRSFLRETVDDWTYSEARKEWYLGGALMVKRADGRTLQFTYSPLAAVLTPTVRSDAKGISGCLYSAASPVPGQMKVTWSYCLDAVDGESVDASSDELVCSRLGDAYEVYAFSEMYEYEGSEHCLRRFLQESVDEWQYDEDLGWGSI